MHTYRSKRLFSLLALLIIGTFFSASFINAQEVSPNLYSGLRWRLIGPHRAGRVTCVAGVLDQPNVYYFGTPGGGVWRFCSYPGCSRSASHRHHVTYNSDHTEPLCSQHHKEITKINIDHSAPGHKLFSKDRRQLYREWKRGEVRPAGSPDDEVWISDWNTKSDF